MMGHSVSEAKKNTCVKKSEECVLDGLSPLSFEGPTIDLRCERESISSTINPSLKKKERVFDGPCELIFLIT